MWISAWHRTAGQQVLCLENTPWCCSSSGRLVALLKFNLNPEKMINSTNFHPLGTALQRDCHAQWHSGSPFLRNSNSFWPPLVHQPVFRATKPEGKQAPVPFHQFTRREPRTSAAMAKAGMGRGCLWSTRSLQQKDTGEGLTPCPWTLHVLGLDHFGKQ